MKASDIALLYANMYICASALKSKDGETFLYVIGIAWLVAFGIILVSEWLKGEPKCE